MDASDSPVKFSGRWKRFWASIIDTLVLTVIVHWPLEALMRGNIRLRDLLIGTLGMLYSVVCHGPVGKGQTLGKRWMKLQVLQVNGDIPSWQTSLKRYFFFGLVNTLALGLQKLTFTMPELIQLVGAVVGGLAAAYGLMDV